MGSKRERDAYIPPRAAVTAGTTSAMRQPTTFNVAPASASHCTWHHSRTMSVVKTGVERGGDIKGALAPVSPVTRFPDWVRGRYR